MGYAELLDLIQKKDTSARKHWFDTFYGRLAAIALRYSKSPEQAEDMLRPALHSCYEKLQDLNDSNAMSMERTVVRHFIAECVTYVKSIRNEYYVASTVNAATPASAPTFNLFENNERPDFDSASPELLVEAIHQLAPSQRLIFNLHVIDGLSMTESADMLESSEAAVKSNLEKARFNLQKIIEKHLKSARS